VSAVEVVFWAAAGLIGYTHAGYPLLLSALARLRPAPSWPAGDLPGVSLVIAAHDEQDVIAEKVKNALALDYPGGRLEVIVASDGSRDRTVERARGAAAGDRRGARRWRRGRAATAGLARGRGAAFSWSRSSDQRAIRPDFTIEWRKRRCSISRTDQPLRVGRRPCRRATRLPASRSVQPPASRCQTIDLAPVGAAGRRGPAHRGAEEGVRVPARRRAGRTRPFPRIPSVTPAWGACPPWLRSPVCGRGKR